jgi:hypothetical protein
VYAGAALTPNYWPDRFYLNQNADVAVGRRIRLLVEFTGENFKSELISFAIFARKYAEG